MCVCVCGLILRLRCPRLSHVSPCSAERVLQVTGSAAIPPAASSNMAPTDSLTGESHREGKPSTGGGGHLESVSGCARKVNSQCSAFVVFRTSERQE